MRARLDEERRVAELGGREVDEGEEKAEEHVAAEGAEHRLVRDALVLQHPHGVEISALIPLVAEALEISDMQSLTLHVERTLTELADLELVGCAPA